MFEEQWKLCFSKHFEGVGRCRTSIYYHGGCPEMAIRLCESAIRPAAELGLPAIVDELTRLPNGLIIVTGPTGVGKTTTLNYMVDVINQNRRAKIVTIEDPVEYVHENNRSIIIQQEVQTDVKSFREALVHVLRQDPDVVVIGEMRDLETIETALRPPRPATWCWPRCTRPTPCKPCSGSIPCFLPSSRIPSWSNWAACSAP